MFYRNRLVVIIFTLTGLVGCWSWPDDYERSVVDVPDVKAEQLSPLVEVVQQKISLLSGQGADYCLPGQMKILRQSLGDIEINLEHDFDFDASEDIVRLYDDIEKVSQMLDLIGRRTECIAEFETNQIKQKKIKKVVASLNSNLNCSCKIFESDEKLSTSFVEKLSDSAQVIKANPNVIIEIHKPDLQHDNDLIETALVSFGVSRERILSFTFIDSGKTPGGNTPFFVATERILYHGEKTKRLRDWELKQVTAESENQEQ
ncbi:hypothetical protein [Spongorhabdus nitratireducens]